MTIADRGAATTHKQTAIAAATPPGATAGALLALGVVFGDIGTSPLYTVQLAFNGGQSRVDSAADIYGFLSLVFWALVIVVTVKYVAIIMRADNKGEGGIMALMALVRRLNVRHTNLLMLLGVFGAALFYGDSMITPAVSVLSAVEGLKIATPAIGHVVIPVVLALLIGLFVAQRHGTHAVSKLFGPVVLVWFVVLAALGVHQIVQAPGVVRAISPSYGVAYFMDHGVRGLIVLGVVVLSVTGAEALYADMGHFGVSAVRRAWLIVAFPALVLNYFGQCALLLREPQAADNPFFRMAPSWAQLGLVILAACATVIASQAVISGAFSMSRQAMQLGFLPRLTVRHTSATSEGQIYVPAVNWMLFVAVCVLVLSFRTSAELADAYGMAVTGTFAMTTALALVVFVSRSRHRTRTIALGLVMLLIDLAFFGANLPKFFSGGWIPICVGAVLFTVLTTWSRGRTLALGQLAAAEIPLTWFIADIAREGLLRVPGSVVYLSALDGGTPTALRKNTLMTHVVHEQVILLTFVTRTVPYVPAQERVAVRDIGNGFTRIVVASGFAEVPDAPRALATAKAQGFPVDPDTVTYFLNSVLLSVTNRAGLAKWRKWLFVTMSRNALHAATFLGVPSDRVMEIGTQVEL